MKKNGLDFNILLEDINEIENLDILNENLFKKVTQGIYDAGTKTGKIEYNAIDENIRDIDKYYIVKITILIYLMKIKSKIMGT